MRSQRRTIRRFGFAALTNERNEPCTTIAGNARTCDARFERVPIQPALRRAGHGVFPGLRHDLGCFHRFRSIARPGLIERVEQRFLRLECGLLDQIGGAFLERADGLIHALEQRFLRLGVGP